MAEERMNNNFDVIRLAAALFVIYTHSFALLTYEKEDILIKLTNGAISFSHMGVAIFFTISGYLITQSAFNSASWKNYLWRRCLRIFPGLAVVLFLSVFVLGPLVTNLSLMDYFLNPKTYKHFITLTLYNINHLSLPGVFTENKHKTVNGSLWTLAYEFTLYIVVLIAFYLKFLNRRFLLLLLWIGMFLLRLYVGENYFVYSYSTPFLLGLNMTYLYEWSFYFLTGMLFLLYKNEFSVRIEFIITLLVAYIVGVYIKNDLLLRMLNYLIIPSVIFYLSFIPGRLNTIAKFGDFSYGFYIYAYPVQQCIVYFTQRNISEAFMVLLSIAATFPLAYLSWHFIEKKALQFKNTFR